MKSERQEESVNRFLSWSVEVHDNLDANTLAKIDSFFFRYFPNVFEKNKASEVLKWKISEINPFGPGFLTVATLDSGEIVGLASAAPRLVRINGEVLGAIEVGDTFTSPEFRKAGNCKEQVSALVLNNITEDQTYFYRSVFGRLMYETLVRARNQGIVFAYGTPNKLSLRPYLKRLGFQASSQGDLCSIYFINQDGKKLQQILSIGQKIILRFVNFLLFRHRTGKLVELDPISWTNEIENNYSQTTEEEFIDKNQKYFQYRYLRHPVNNYFYFKFVDYKGKANFYIVRKKNPETLQIVEAPAFLEDSNLIQALLQIREYFGGESKILIWRKLNRIKKLKLTMCGLVVINNLNFIYRWLDHRQCHLELNQISVGDSDNG